MQCKMLNVPKSSYYNYIKESVDPENALIERVRKIYDKEPAYGSRRIKEILCRQGTKINRKKVQRLMREMKIAGVYPKRNLSRADLEHTKYPFIARDEPIVRINQVWSTDITYIKTKFGFVYLVAIIDWYSRMIIEWKMSNCMGEQFCIDAVENALKRGVPGIFNTDQGSQFTGNAFVSIILKNGIKPSMDGKGRATDNAQIERFWRSVKWEEVYLHEPQNYIDLQKMIARYIAFYNHERPHQSVNYKTPSEIHFGLEKKPFDFNGYPMYTEKELNYVATW